MPYLSQRARKLKIDFFLCDIPKDARILEVGCGGGWLGEYARNAGWTGYVGIDLGPPADILGDIRNWRECGITESSFDVIIAFEVVEHVPWYQECYDILRAGGILMLTTNVPHMGWVGKILERVGLVQRRTSLHDHLIFFEDVSLFEPVQIRQVAGLAQWVKFRKPLRNPREME